MPSRSHFLVLFVVLLWFWLSQELVWLVVKAVCTSGHHETHSSDLLKGSAPLQGGTGQMTRNVGKGFVEGLLERRRAPKAV